MLAFAAKLAGGFALYKGLLHGYFAMDGLQFTSLDFGIRFAFRAIGSSIRIRFTRTNSRYFTDFEIYFDLRYQVFFDGLLRDGIRLVLIYLKLEFGKSLSGEVERFR